MKTEYGMYAIFDAELGAFLPETFGIFLSDKQYIQAVVNAMLQSPEKEVEARRDHFRFYRVGNFDVDRLSVDADELSARVFEMYDLGRLKEKEKNVEK